MKQLTLKTVAILTLMAMVYTLEAKEPGTTMPAEIHHLLTKELLEFKPTTMETFLCGNVWVKFYIDDNCQVNITEMSSDNLTLGEEVKNKLTTLPAVSNKCPKGVSYNVRIGLSYRLQH